MVFDDDLAQCPECGASIEEGALQDHIRKVHGRRHEPDAEHRPTRTWALWGIGIGIAALLVVLVLREGQEPQWEIDASGEPYWGDAEAQDTVFLWLDYQCAHCKELVVGGELDRFLERWVQDGSVRVVFKDYPGAGADSETAAIASQVVWSIAPERWAEWNRYIFTNQGDERSGWADRDGITVLTRAWGGIDMDAFRAAMDDDAHRNEVLADQQEARAAGIDSTPMMLIGRERVDARHPDDLDAAMQARTEGSATPAPSDT